MTDNNGDKAETAIAVGSGDSDIVSDSGAAAHAAWAIAKPERREYAIAVSELISARLVGEGGILDWCPHVCITHMGYFKPPNDSLIDKLRSQHRRSVKEWDFLNSSSDWMELRSQHRRSVKEWDFLNSSSD